MNHIVGEVINAVDTRDLVMVAFDMNVLAIKKQDAGIVSGIVSGEIGTARQFRHDRFNFPIDS